MKNTNEIVVGKLVKISHVLIGAAAIVLLSLFVTGFGYLLWWVFLIVLILGIFITLPTCFNSYWRINKEEVKITSYSNNDAIKLMQLLGLHKKDEQVIKLANIENAESIKKISESVLLILTQIILTYILIQKMDRNTHCL